MLWATLVTSLSTAQRLKSADKDEESQAPQGQKRKKWFFWTKSEVTEQGAVEFTDTDGKPGHKFGRAIDTAKTIYQAFLLHWPPSGVRYNRALEWRTDEEFARAVSFPIQYLLKHQHRIFAWQLC